MTVRLLQKSISPSKSPSEYKVAIKEATEILVSLGLVDILKSGVSLVEGVEQLNDKLEGHEISLYGKPLEEKTLLAEIAEDKLNIAKVDAEIAKVDAEIAEAKAKIAEAKAKIAEADAEIAKFNAEIAEADAKIAQAEALG